nr:uncharacterized protein LOC111751966 [Loxodonta africana]
MMNVMQILPSRRLQSARAVDTGNTSMIDMNKNPCLMALELWSTYKRICSVHYSLKQVRDNPAETTWDKNGADTRKRISTAYRRGIWAGRTETVLWSHRLRKTTISLGTSPEKSKEAEVEVPVQSTPRTLRTTRARQDADRPARLTGLPPCGLHSSDSITFPSSQASHSRYLENRRSLWLRHALRESVRRCCDRCTGSTKIPRQTGSLLGF